MPLALVVPGCAIAAALFPPGSLPPGERLVYAVGFSVAATVLAGVIAQQLFDLGRAGWALLLLAVAVAAWAVALRRQKLRGEPAPPVLPRPPRIAPQSLLAILAAVALAAVAVAVASDSARDEREDARFTALSALPRGASQGSGQTVEIELLNHEGRRTTYTLRLTSGGESLRSRRLALADGAEWRRSVPVPRISPAAPLRIELLRRGRPYRTLELRDGGEDE